MRVVRDEVARLAPEVRKVAAAAPGHQDFFADAVGALEDKHRPTALCSSEGTHEAGSAAPNHNNVGMGHAARISGSAADETYDSVFTQAPHAFDEGQLGFFFGEDDLGCRVTAFLQ